MTAKSLDGMVLTDLLAERARQTPTAAALRDSERSITYIELLGLVERLAGQIAWHRLPPEAVVAVSLNRSLELVVAFLATLRAGAAWLPLDPAYPHDRLSFMLAEAAPALLLSERALLAALPPWSGATLLLEDGDAAPEAALPPPPSAGQLAYLLYTSGSTGRPKGVLVEHRGLVNLARAQAAFFGVTAESQVLQFASPNFDAFVSEVAMALQAGACLHLATPEALLPGAALAATFRERAVTHVTLPPSALAAMQPSQLAADLTIAVAGEACSAELVRRWAPGRRFINAYGPTEATVCATMALCDPADPAPPPIGGPMTGVRLLLLSDDGRPVPAGESGEILIGGRGLARGYLARPALTAARFVADPERPGERLYRTGDLGRFRPDGRLDFLGRIDLQMKIRGYRIEPGEIEAALADHPAVAAAVVVPEAAAAGRRLVGCILPRDPGAALPDLRPHLRARLPQWMVPARWVGLAALPLLPNGKVDRAALPPAEEEPAGAPAAGPRDDVEQRVLLLWEEVLGRGGFGVEDDYFAVGGDSLSAAILLSRLAAAFGCSLPPALMAREPTVAALARVLRAGGGGVWSPLVPFRPSGDQTPLVCVHPAGGTVICYRALAGALPPPRPFWGLQAHGYEADQRPETTVEALATRYVAALQEELPPGPVALAGWSFGAVVALEMAQQLGRAGREVANLIALDALLDPDLPVVADDDIVLRLVRLYSALQGGDPRTIAAPSGGDSDARIVELVERAVADGIFPPGFDLAQGRRLAAVTGSCFQAAASYRPGPWGGRVTLIRASRVGVAVEDPTLGWSSIAPALEILWTPGDHLTMMRPPAVAALAERIEAILSGASLRAFREPAPE